MIAVALAENLAEIDTRRKKSEIPFFTLSYTPQQRGILIAASLIAKIVPTPAEAQMSSTLTTLRDSGHVVVVPPLTDYDESQTRAPIRNQFGRFSPAE